MRGLGERARFTPRTMKKLIKPFWLNLRLNSKGLIVIVIPVVAYVFSG